MGNHNPYLTTTEIREYMQDRRVVEGLPGLVYDEKDLLTAMRRGAAAYNDEPPVFIKVSPDEMPNDSNACLNAVIEQLYIIELGRLTRNDIEYTAGDVMTSIDRPRIGHLKELIKFHGETFRTAARLIKNQINLQRGFRHFH